VTNVKDTFSIFDGHNDALLAISCGGEQAEREFLDGGSDYQLDLPKAKAGGFVGGLFAIFIPRESGRDVDELRAVKTLSPPVGFERSVVVANQQLNALYRLAANSFGRFAVCASVQEIIQHEHQDAIAAVAHLEGAEPIAADLSNLEEWYGRGVRSIGLAWSRPNVFGWGVPLRFPSSPDIGQGLSYAGKELTRQCRRLGILVDVSHLNEEGFWDVAKIGGGPIVASHSNVHAICPSARNLTSEQLSCIADTDGLVGVCFNTADLYPDGASDTTRPLDTLLDHIDALLNQIGETRVGIGSDFDGCPIPDVIGTASGLTHLIVAMQARGYSQSTIKRIAHDNWLRVLDAVWVKG